MLAGMREQEVMHLSRDNFDFKDLTQTGFPETTPDSPA
jgi:hypothetical protein